MSVRRAGANIGTISELTGAVSAQRGQNERVDVRAGASVSGLSESRGIFRVKVLAVDTGPPATYRVRVLTGWGDTETNWVIGGSSPPYGVLGTTDEAQFAVGDKAVLFYQPPAPGTLITGGTGASGTAHFLNVYDETGAG